MNKTGIIFIIFALLIAALFTSFIYKYQSNKKSNQSGGNINILVATRDIKRGETVSKEDLRWQSWPKSALEPTFILQTTKKIEDLDQAIARQSIATGQPVRDDMVVPKGLLSPLASILKPGMRAYTIEMDRNTPISGLIFPGDTVDVVLTYTQNKNSRDKEVVGKTILHGIKVLGVDQNINPSKDASSSRNPGNNIKSVTLEVVPRQAEILAIARSMGTLTLSLSGPISNENEVRDVDIAELLQQQPKAAAQSTTKEFSIITIHGEKAVP